MNKTIHWWKFTYSFLNIEFSAQGHSGSREETPRQFIAKCKTILTRNVTFGDFLYIRTFLHNRNNSECCH